MSTPIDFISFAMNRLKIINLTKANLVGPVYNLLKCTCKSYVELKYNMEECYKALNDQLDWNNLEGDRYPFDLSKLLPLVKSRNHHIIPADYFFNNDLAYLQGGSNDRTYTTSLTKTKAAKYDLQGIEDMVPTVSKHDVYSTKRILAVTNVKVNKWYGYGHPKEIKVQRLDQKLYKFIEGHCALGCSITYVYEAYCNLEEYGRSLTWCQKLPEEDQHFKAIDAQGWHH
ncbi:hypothetical protein Tco_0467950 [Tanacetum coccineum]